VDANGANRLIEEVTAWPEVTIGEGRFHSTRFLVGRRELGHVHAPSTLDMPLPKQLKAELIERGEAMPHRFTPPTSGWVTMRLDLQDGVDRAIELLRERYEHALAVQARRADA
jgi:hypothetical protein